MFLGCFPSTVLAITTVFKNSVQILCYKYKMKLNFSVSYLILLITLIIFSHAF